MQSTTARVRNIKGLESRRAGREDIPFLAEIDEIASTPPFERSLWTDFTEPTGTSVRDFIIAVLENDASGWGRVEDFVVLSLDGAPAAAAAVFDADPDAGPCLPLIRNRLPKVAGALGWSEATTADFIAAYDGAWGANSLDFLRPQATAIIESVGVLPAFRGRGLGAALMDAARSEAQRRGHASLGIMAIHGNEPALQLYAKHFEAYATYHSAYFDHRFPGVTKFRALL